MSERKEVNWEALKEADVPYIKEIYDNTDNIRRYIAKMKLAAFKNFTFEDTYRWE